MIIKELILHKNKRIGLGRIGTLIYRPNRKMQLILGTNGSGKSTMLQELFPIPITIPSDYLDDGYKSITVEHNGKIYNIKSIKEDNTLKHSFIVDGMELNKTGKKNKEIELVYEHFGIDNNLCQILSGNISFTSMSYMDRKKWFIRMSNMDYDYVLSVYNRIRDRYKEVSANIKLIKHKILNSKESLLEDDEVKILEVQIKVIKQCIRKLIELKPDYTVGEKIELSTIYSKIDNIVDAIDSLPVVEKDINTLQTDKIKVDRLLTELETKVYTMEKSIKEYIEFENKINTLKDTDIDSELSYVCNKIKEYKKTLPFSIDIINDYRSFITTVENVYELLQKYDKTVRQPFEIKSDIYNIKTKIDKIEKRINRLYHILETHKEGTVCPKCKYSFIPGTKLENRQSVENLYEVNRLEHDKLNKQLNKLEKELHVSEENISLLKYLQNKRKDKIYDIVLSILYTDNNINIDNITILYDYGKIIESLFKYMDRKNTLLKEKEIKDKYKLSELDTIRNKKELLEKELLDIYGKINALKSHQEKLDFDISIIKRLKELRKQLIEVIFIFRKQVRKKIRHIYATNINEFVSDLDKECSRLEKKYNDNERIKYEIETDNKLLKNLIEEKNRLDTSMRLLSPDKGLIAMSIVSFIDNFITDMNEVLSAIWEYNIHIHGCDMDNNDMDYKFPISVNNTITIPDVSKTSSSMKEVIDLSYKIVFMKYMGLSTWPLYLDEFGRAMDATHQNNAYDCIDRLLESDIFSQIYLISHYENCYGRFKNADINVIHNDNIRMEIKDAILEYIPE